MGAVVDRAEQLATLLGTSTIRATTDIRDTVPPCLLVVPVPRREYVHTQAGADVDVTWTIVALALPPADLQAARALEELVDHAAGLVDITTAEPASYVIPTSETAVPAYLITVTETATEAPA